jgi:glycosyltransferase involved in cell wall biosynthesis
VSRRDRTRPLDARPLVSIILPTRDRPRLLATTLECYRLQTYPHRELIVLDDGEEHPVGPAAIEALGGRLIRVEAGTTLGAKLNRGAGEARGSFCQKMDDDDWYAPAFLETMVSAVLTNQREVCRPTLAFLKPFLFFDLAHWEIRQSGPSDASGATFFFSREDWQERPFRGVRGDEDLWFFLDQLRLGTTLLPVDAPQTYLAVRHRAATNNRGHTWTRHHSGRSLDQDLLERPLRPGGPEALLPAWALEFYRDFRRELLGGTSPARRDNPVRSASADSGDPGQPPSGGHPNVRSRALE